MIPSQLVEISPFVAQINQTAFEKLRDECHLSEEWITDNFEIIWDAKVKK